MKNNFYILLVFILVIQVGCTNNYDQALKSPPNASVTSVSINTQTTSSANVVAENSSTLSSVDVSSNSNSYSQNLTGNINSNMTYGGRIVKDGKWLYFSLDSMNLQQDGIGICKMKSDGSNFSVLVNDWSKCFNISAEYLYYIKTHDGGLSEDIYRIKKDGTQEEKLLEGECINLMLIGNKLYFTCMSEDKFAYKLYRMNIDGTQKELLIQERCGANFLYSNGFVYIEISIERKDGGFDAALCKININDSKQKRIIAHNFDASPAFFMNSSFYIHKDKIFYINAKDNHAYSMNDDGISVKKINNVDVNTMVISEEGKIYCFSWDIGSGTIIYSFDLDGKNLTKINTLDQYCYLVGIVDDYLYFNEDWGEGDITNNGRIKTDGSNLKYLVDYLKK